MSWSEIAQRQGGVLTRDQLRSEGVTRWVAQRLLAEGALTFVARGVLAVRGAPHTQQMRLWSAALATGGVIGFATAAALWEVDDVQVGRIGTIDVIVAHSRRVTTPPGVRLHRVFVPRSEVTTRDGLPVSSRSWTVLDQLGGLPAGAAFRLADRALQRQWITEPDVRRRLRDYPGRTGNRRLREIAARLGDGAAAESERLLHSILRATGVTGWKANHPVVADGRVIAVLDVALVAQHLAIEVDGWAYHSDIDRFQRDRQRQNALVSLGWTVLRFTWADLTQRPGYVAATVRAQLNA